MALNSARLRGLPRPELAQPEQGGHAAHDDEQDEEERGEPEPGRRQQAVEVERHSRDDEVDRDQEAEPDPLQTHADGASLGRVERQADDEAAGERAEDEVEAHLDREGDQAARARMESRTAA